MKSISLNRIAYVNGKKDWKIKEEGKEGKRKKSNNNNSYTHNKWLGYFIFSPFKTVFYLNPFSFGGKNGPSFSCKIVLNILRQPISKVMNALEALGHVGFHLIFGQ